jgi:hypothetical protein
MLNGTLSYEKVDTDNGVMKLGTVLMTTVTVKLGLIRMLTPTKTAI